MKKINKIWMWAVGFVSFWFVFSLAYSLGLGSALLLMLDLSSDRSILERFQTLIAALFAVGIGGFSLRAMWTQISDERRKTKELQFKRSLAARARLPLALNELCRFTESCANTLIASELTFEDFPGLPSVPLFAIENIIIAIEFVDTDSAVQLADLLICYQVHNAMFEKKGELPENFAGLSRAMRSRSETAIALRLRRTADLRLVINNVFPFARRGQDFIPNPACSLENHTIALRNCCRDQDTPSNSYLAAVDLIERIHSLAMERGGKVYLCGLDTRPEEERFKEFEEMLLS